MRMSVAVCPRPTGAWWRSRGFASRVLVLWLSAALSVPSAAFAQAGAPPAGGSQTPAAPSQPDAPAQPPGAAVIGQPPVLTFGPDGLTLDEAIRLTLRHEPNILLGAANLDRLAGVTQEQGGIFDLTLLGTASYEYRIQELTETRKQAERDKRERIADSIEKARPDVANAQRSLDILRQIQANPGNDANLVAQLTTLSPSLGTQLGALNAIIANTPPNQRAELERVKSQFLTDAINQSAALLQPQIDSFEASQQNLANLGAAPDDEVFQNYAANVQFSKLFRSGVTVAPFFDLRMESSNFRDKPKEEAFGGKGLNDLWTLKTGVSFIFPLLRGRGADGVAAFERAAAVDQQAGSLDLDHERSLSVLTTAQAYWEVRAAQDSLGVLDRSVLRYGDLIKATEALVTGGERPKVELVRAQAGDARARAQQQEGRRRLTEARTALTTALGVATPGDPATLPLARDPFPQAPPPSALQPWLGAGAVGEERRDVQAAIRREESAGILERGAVTELRPRLDFTASTYYTAFGEVGPVETDKDVDGNPIFTDFSFSDVVDRWVGPSFTLSMNYEKPLGNNAAQGRLTSREAERRQQQILLGDRRRQVRLGVTRTAQSLLEALQRLEQAQNAAKYYDTTVQSEVQLFRAGESTLIDTILTEQQQTEAELATVAARQDVANLIAQLRFETGTLVSAGAAPVPNVVTPPTGRQP
jgi:outer membrane protein TolC